MNDEAAVAPSPSPASEPTQPVAIAAALDAQVSAGTLRISFHQKPAALDRRTRERCWQDDAPVPPVPVPVAVVAGPLVIVRTDTNLRRRRWGNNLTWLVGS